MKIELSLSPEEMQDVVKALKKQEERKVCWYNHTVATGIEKWPHCPNCGSRLMYEQRYCKDCGQKMDWQEVEE